MLHHFGDLLLEYGTQDMSGYTDHECDNILSELHVSWASYPLNSAVSFPSSFASSASTVADGNKVFVIKAEYIYMYIRNYSMIILRWSRNNIYIYICKLAYIFIYVHTYYRYILKYANIHI